MAALRKFKSHPNAVDYFKELPFLKSTLKNSNA